MGELVGGRLQRALASHAFHRLTQIGHVRHRGQVGEGLDAVGAVELSDISCLSGGGQARVDGDPLLAQPLDPGPFDVGDRRHPARIEPTPRRHPAEMSLGLSFEITARVVETG